MALLPLTKALSDGIVFPSQESQKTHMASGKQPLRYPPQRGPPPASTN